MAKLAAKKKQFSKEILSKRSFLIIMIGLLTLVIGFILMAQPPVNGFLSRTLAPLILVIAYLIIIPAALLFKEKNSKI